jgi:hypothetical protein
MSLSLRLVPHEVTSRHSASAYPWQYPPAPAGAGPLVGLDVLSGGLWRFDPWELYRNRVITSLGMLVLGRLGRGKSAAVKTYADRHHQACGVQLLVLDPKGEYGGLADRLGLARIDLAPGGRCRLNPLDPGPQPDVGQLGRSRAVMLEALAACGLDRRLEPAERAGLSAVAANLDPAATLVDAVGGLLEPGLAVAASVRMSGHEAAVALRPVGLALGQLVDGPLAGMLDGPATIDIAWDGPGLVLDLSATFGTDALGPVMVCAGAWLARLLSSRGRRRILILDEAWALLARPELARWLQSVVKLSRTFGVQVIVVTHRLSDLSGQADEGSAAQRQAQGLLADLETHVLFGQPAAEQSRAVDLLGLTPVEAEAVCHLPPFRALWRAGRMVGLVDHLLGPGDDELIDTDQAFATGA